MGEDRKPPTRSKPPGKSAERQRSREVPGQLDPVDIKPEWVPSPVSPLPVEERDAAGRDAVTAQLSQRRKHKLRTLYKEARQQLLAEDAARMQMMAEAGDADGVRAAIIDLLPGPDHPVAQMAARIIAGEIRGVNGISKAEEIGRARGRPWETEKHRTIATEVYQTRAKLRNEGVGKGEAMERACQSAASKYNLTERTVMDIYAKSEVAKAERFLRRAARWS